MSIIFESIVQASWIVHDMPVELSDMPSPRTAQAKWWVCPGAAEVPRPPLIEPHKLSVASNNLASSRTWFSLPCIDVMYFANFRKLALELQSELLEVLLDHDDETVDWNKPTDRTSPSFRFPARSSQDCLKWRCVHSCSRFRCAALPEALDCLQRRWSLPSLVFRVAFDFDSGFFRYDCDIGCGIVLELDRNTNEVHCDKLVLAGYVTDWENSFRVRMSLGLELIWWFQLFEAFLSRVVRLRDYKAKSCCRCLGSRSRSRMFPWHRVLSYLSHGLRMRKWQRKFSFNNCGSKHCPTKDVTPLKKNNKKKNKIFYEISGELYDKLLEKFWRIYCKNHDRLLLRFLEDYSWHLRQIWGESIINFKKMVLWTNLLKNLQRYLLRLLREPPLINGKILNESLMEFCAWFKRSMSNAAQNLWRNPTENFKDINDTFRWLLTRLT